MAYPSSLAGAQVKELLQSTPPRKSNLKAHLEKEGGSQETDKGGQGRSSNGLVGSVAGLHGGADDGTVGDGGGGVGGSAVGAAQQLLGLVVGNVAEPVVLDVLREGIGVGGTDNILESSISHNNGTTEPVTTVVGVDQTILTEDSLVGKELVVSSVSGGQTVGGEEGSHVRTSKGLVNDDVDILDGGQELGRGGEGALGGAVVERRTGIDGEDLLVVGTGEGPGSGVVVEGRGGDVGRPGNDGLGGLGVGGALEAVVVVVDRGGQLLGGLFQVKEGRVELEPLSALFP